MNNLQKNNYLTSSKGNFELFSVLIGSLGIIGAFIAVMSLKEVKNYLEVRSFFAIFGGTLGVLLFQYNFSVLFRTFKLGGMSLLGIRDKKLISVLNELDQAIVNKTYLSQLREAKEINGDYINDALFMIQKGLVFEEIESFFHSKFSSEYFKRDATVDFLRKGASIAPALGLFGTVMGLIGVLKSLSDPSQIGPSMSLALMTTAYGAGLGTLIFTPLLGRVEQHNFTFLEVHEQLLSKMKIIIFREERRFDRELHIDDEDQE